MAIRPRFPEERSDAPEAVRIEKEEVVWGGLIFAHYGHFLIESISRLWPLLAGGELEGLPVAFSAPRQKPTPIRLECDLPSPQELPFVRDWLTAFGARVIELPENDGVRFTKMFVPEPAWRLNAWVAPEIRDIHLYARQRMEVPQRSPCKVTWLSRSRLGRYRSAYDEALFEWLLDDHLEIVHPEKMPLAEQVAAFERSDTVAGVIGSAFHTLLLTMNSPDCLYLCPAWDKSSFPAQHLLVDSQAHFVQALVVAEWTPRLRRTGLIFPFGYRLLIPEVLHALNRTALPGLLNDARLAAFANPERHWPKIGQGSATNDVDTAIAKVLSEPLSIAARMELGEIFDALGVPNCALEQFVMAADLSHCDATPILHAARLLHRGGQTEAASRLATEALAIDPTSKEAAEYVKASS